MEIVLNEKEWVEGLVAKHSLGDRPWWTIKKYAIYLHTQGYTNQEKRRILEDYVLRCDPDANRMQWAHIIDRAVKESGVRHLVQLDGVSISAGEMKVIESLSGSTKQKLVFTLLCLAKYRNAVNPKNNWWINLDVSCIFNLANIIITRKRQMLLLHDLCNLGVIGHSRVVDNVSIQVKIREEDSVEALFVNDFRNLGNQYMILHSDGYIECAECGLVVRRASNHQKYCKQCAEKVNKVLSADRYHGNIA